MLKSENIKAIAREVGFDLCGITSARNYSAEKEFFGNWLLRGNAGGMEYLARNVEKRFDPALLVPGVKTIVVCAVVYKNDTSLGYGDYSELPKVASYSRSRDYHFTVKEMLSDFAARIRVEYGEIAFRTFTDSAPVSEKKLAYEAGLGFIGRNKLLVSPAKGSFMVLGELFLDREVDCCDVPMESVGCGSCRRCVDSCPNGALTDYGLDARRCISRLTIEKMPDDDMSGNINDLHGWAFGCDVCQSVCPYNVSAPLFSNSRFAPLFDPRTISTDDWRRMTSAEFAERFSGTPLERAGYERIRESAIRQKR